uniref:Uncharacterized protein n=1 Tax=Knipowitschia caucasica TaxID=637954 RepID=A0AAV2KID0_KNICA
MLKPVVKPAEVAHLAPHSPSEPEVTPLDDSSSSDVWLLVSETNGPVGAPSAPPCVPPSLSLRALTLLPLLREAAVSLGPWSCAGGEPHTVVGGPVGTYVGLCGVSAALGNAFCSFWLSEAQVVSLPACITEDRTTTASVNSQNIGPSMPERVASLELPALVDQDAERPEPEGAHSFATPAGSSSLFGSVELCWWGASHSGWWPCWHVCGLVRRERCPGKRLLLVLLVLNYAQRRLRARLRSGSGGPVLSLIAGPSCTSRGSLETANHHKYTNSEPRFHRRSSSCLHCSGLTPQARVAPVVDTDHQY